MDIKITKKLTPTDTNDAGIGFGKVFTDHMFLMNYDEGIGWHDARIEPFHNLSIHPASTVLHYGEEIFEGLKAYRTPSGDIQMFRVIENVRRMNNSAERLCLPQIPEQDLYNAIVSFVTVEKEWTPSLPGTSLYIRPFMFGNDESLGVHTVKSAVFCIIASPSGAYFKQGFKPVKIMIEDEDVRAVRGGTGYAKCGGNYAASTRAGDRAEAKGYSQVLWLDGVERKYIEEVGAMNVMFLIGDEVVTPALTGSILPGVTRKSSVELLKSKGYKVSERLLSLQELVDSMHNGTLKEAWGCGTAAVIAPIGTLAYKDEVYTINNGVAGPVATMLHDELVGIQYGQLPDPFGWVVPIE